MAWENSVGANILYVVYLGWGYVRAAARYVVQVSKYFKPLIAPLQSVPESATLMTAQASSVLSMIREVSTNLGGGIIRKVGTYLLDDYRCGM